MGDRKNDKVWTVAEAKARLSEILRLAAEQGPQRIGTQKRYVVVTEAEWEKHAGKSKGERLPLGRWLVEHMPRGAELELPSRVDPPRPIPFVDDEP